MKIDIDVMMLFKFDVKYVKLNVKAIASIEFSFDIKFYLLCSYDSYLFILENSSFTSFERSKITFDPPSEAMTNLFDSIDTRLLVDKSIVLFRLIEQQ